ncbi:MAG: GguC protein, partial [Rhizobiaceae bacterium]|nr:GguC protein [Rhizobiaceae bacterium]
MLISEIEDEAGTIHVVAREGSHARVVRGARSVYALALEAARGGTTIASLIEQRGYGDTVDLEAAYRKGRVRSP